MAGITTKTSILKNVKFYLKVVSNVQGFLYLLLMELFEFVIQLREIPCCCCC